MELLDLVVVQRSPREVVDLEAGVELQDAEQVGENKTVIAGADNRVRRRNFPDNFFIIPFPPGLKASQVILRRLERDEAAADACLLQGLAD